MKKFIAIATLLIAGNFVFAQKYKTTTGSVSFFSKAKLENIDAKNNQATALLDASNGNLAFIVLIKSFEFDKKLMQTHFNNNYMESDKYPKGTFDGKITNNSSVKYGTDGTYNVSVSGKLTIHGVTKNVTESGTVTVKGSNVTLKSTFKVKLSDYGIKNDKTKYIASEIEVTVNSTLAKQ